MADRLGLYIEENAERWFAVHQRIEGLSAVVMILATVVSKHPNIKADIIEGLSAIENLQSRSQEHPALIAELRRLRETLEREP